MGHAKIEKDWQDPRCQRVEHKMKLDEINRSLDTTGFLQTAKGREKSCR